MYRVRQNPGTRTHLNSFNPPKATSGKQGEEGHDNSLREGEEGCAEARTVFSMHVKELKWPRAAPLPSKAPNKMQVMDTSSCREALDAGRSCKGWPANSFGPSSQTP
jgi:hypothetical protein